MILYYLILSYIILLYSLKGTAIHRGRTIETDHRVLGQRPKIDPFTMLS